MKKLGIDKGEMDTSDVKTPAKDPREGLMPVNILLVDDRKENIFSLESLFSDLKIKTFSARSGAEALGLMVDNDFALAILDVQMPEMDGFELAELMRGAEKTREIPIIFLTAASRTDGFEFKGYEAGAVDFLNKPVDPKILKSKVQIFMELAEQRQLLKAKILELDKAKKDAETAKESAVKANQLKSAFLANMSHEIRTPLGAMMGFAELLRASPLVEDDKNNYTDIIIRNGRALVQLIDEILDLSKVEAGHLEVEVSRFSLLEVVEDVKSLLSPSAEKKSLDFNIHFTDRVPPSLHSDSLRFRQILLNIIGNAIKFTQKGRVHVLIDYLDAGEDSVLSFTVEDSGIGMTPEQSSKLFQPFVQADQAITRKFGGTGLGLVLCKKLSNLLGGDVILVRSQHGAGSTFRISVKDQKQLSKSSVAPAKELSRTVVSHEEGLDHLRVLIVDDSPDNQALIRLFLERAGAEVESADDGKMGVQKAFEGSYDVILMDIQMPICDGLEATKILRERGYKGTIIALTANAMREERTKCLSAGCNEYLSKPIDRQLLVSTLRRLSPSLTPKIVDSIL